MTGRNPQHMNDFVNATPLSWAHPDASQAFHDPSHVEFRPCPVCSGTRSRAVWSIEDFQFFSDAADVGKRVPVRVVRCQQCHALYLDPCWSAAGFAALFAEAGCSYGSSSGRPAEQRDWLAARGLLDAGRSLLDAGCYDGRFLSALPAGVARLGVDIDAPAIARGQARDPALTLIHGDFERFDCPRAPDAITMFHVLEHLPRPVAVLRHLRRLAHASTRLVIEVPVLERGMTNDINGFFSVQHMTHFSRASLALALAQGGWQPLETVDMPGYNGCRVLSAPSDEGSQWPNADPGDVGRLHDYLAAWHTAVAAVERRLEPVRDWSRLVLWGAGLHSEFLWQLTMLFDDPSRECLLVDGDPLKHGRRWRGLPVLPPQVLQTVDWTGAGLVISSYGNQPAMLDAAAALGVPAARIITLYESVRRY